MKPLKLLMSMLLLCASFAMQGFEVAKIKEPETSEIVRYFGPRRPFSWYYPYSYQYYYPQNGMDSCFWIYSNGAYFYQCN